MYLHWFECSYAFTCLSLTFLPLSISFNNHFLLILFGILFISLSYSLHPSQAESIFHTLWGQAAESALANNQKDLLRTTSTNPSLASSLPVFLYRSDPFRFAITSWEDHQKRDGDKTAPDVGVDVGVRGYRSTLTGWIEEKGPSLTYVHYYRYKRYKMSSGWPWISPILPDMLTSWQLM